MFENDHEPKEFKAESYESIKEPKEKEEITGSQS